MKNTKINKLTNLPILHIIFCIIIFILVIYIYSYSYKSPFKLRRSIPSIYFDGNIYNAYGSIGNPYMLQGNQAYIELPFFQSYDNYKAPNVDMLLYGQNAPYVMN